MLLSVAFLLLICRASSFSTHKFIPTTTRLLQSSSSSAPYNTAVVTPQNDDSRTYRAVTLSNGLSCVLISSPTTSTSACSVTVNIGHCSDPLSHPGLSHFLEHMLFLGTEQEPTENGFEDWLSENGGGTNAYTDLENTGYYFSVCSDDNNSNDSR